MKQPEAEKKRVERAAHAEAPAGALAIHTVDVVLAWARDARCVAECDDIPPAVHRPRECGGHARVFQNHPKCGVRVHSNALKEGDKSRAVRLSEGHELSKPLIFALQLGQMSRGLLRAFASLRLGDRPLRLLRIEPSRLQRALALALDLTSFDLQPRESRPAQRAWTVGCAQMRCERRRCSAKARRGAAWRFRRVCRWAE